jgi:hypothetical protein
VSTRRLLVVPTVPVDDALLEREVRRHGRGEEVEIRIVTPAAHLSPLEWLASDEDRARKEAEEVARDASEAVEGAGRVEAEVGDTDPLQAIEDALRTFRADELLVVTPPAEDAGWLEEASAKEVFGRFGLPVTHLVVEGG